MTRSEIDKRYRLKRREKGLCRRCPNKATNNDYCDSCAKKVHEIHRKSDKNRYRNNPEYRQRQLKKAKQAGLELKRETFNHYGGCICMCCCEEDITVLTLDHKNGDGADHRRQFMKGQGGGVKMYRWLRNNNFPPGFQVLCFNCNAAKGKSLELPSWRVNLHKRNI